MPKFTFTAKSQKGEAYSGAREAGNELELARALRQEGHILISAIAEKGKKPFSFSLPSFFFFWARVSAKEKMIFARNLQVMLGAGVALPRTLHTLSEQAKSPAMKKALLGIENEITRGKSFSQALSEYPRIFSEFFINMVKVGEESGTLDKNMSILVRQMEREEELKSKVQGALLYPAVIIAAMIGIGIMMLIVVVPKLAQTFEDLEVELPLATKLVIGIASLLTERWYAIIFAIVILFFFAQAAVRTKTGKKMAGSLFLGIPVISAIIKKTNSAYTVRTLSALMAAGVPLLRSLEIVSDTLGNFYYKKAIFQAIEVVRKGGKLSDALKPYRDLFSLTVIQMVEVGEETGESSEVLEKLGNFFEEEVAIATKNLTSVIEPVLMLLVGGVVGFFAVSMIQPMDTMLQGLE